MEENLFEVGTISIFCLAVKCRHNAAGKSELQGAFDIILMPESNLVTFASLEPRNHTKVALLP